MPELTIQGNKIKRIHRATVEVMHPEEAREATQIPTIQFVVELPLDHETMIAEWALAPLGQSRWKRVELQTTDRSRAVNHTWVMLKGYIHKYEELEFPADSGPVNAQGNFVRITIRGTLQQNNIDYDGKNIVTVSAGVPEPAPA